MEEMPAYFGKYKVEGSLGEGGMSHVWRASQSELGDVAIKELKATYLRGLFVEGFKNEVKIIRKLKHQSIVIVHDFELESERGTPYFIMELMEGSLGDGNHPIKHPPKECIALLKPIAGALDYVHKYDPPIIHCDVKPSNILFDKEGNPYLSDFGIARWEFSPVPSPGTGGPGGVEKTEIHPRNGSYGGFAGTLEYAAPELITGEGEPSAASDIYSLAVVAFEILIGERPFQVVTVDDVDKQTRLETWGTMHRTRQGLPDFALSVSGGLLHNRYQEAFEKALHKDPDQRYRTATDFINDLEKARISGPKDELVTFKELPGLLLGRSDEGSTGMSVEAYRHLRRRGSLALLIWLGTTVGALALWRLGRLGALPPFMQSGSLWEILTENGLRIFSVRLLGNWGFIVWVAALLLIYLLCRLFIRVAERADSDRYWQKERINSLTEDLKSVAKLAYSTQNKTKNGPPKLGELYRRVGIKPKNSLPEKMSNYRPRNKACEDFVSQCEKHAILFRLQMVIRQVNNHPTMVDDANEEAIKVRYIRRNVSRYLKNIERVAVVICSAMLLPATWAVLYWANNTSLGPYAALCAGGIVLLWLISMVVTWRALPTQVIG